MSRLADFLLTAEKHQAVVRDVCALIDEEVARKSGLGGLAIKGGYAVVKGVKPGIITGAVEDMLPEFVEKLEPFWADHQKESTGNPMEAFLRNRSGSMAEALLSITDSRAARAKNQILKKTYEKLRPYGKKNVEEAAPGIGRLIDRHAR